MSPPTAKFRKHPTIWSSMLGVLRSAPCVCNLAFAVPRFLASCTFQRGNGMRTYLSVTEARIDRERRSARRFQIRRSHARSMCLSAAAATEAAPQAGKEKRGDGADELEEFENELNTMMAVEAGVEAEVEDEGSPLSPRRLSLLESNVNILEQDCQVAQLFAEAASSRESNLYLGLDISTQSTGYAVLQPSTRTMGFHADMSGHSDDDAKRDELLRELGEASLVEWGCISGSTSGGKKGDEVDVGVLVEETLMQVAARCGRRARDADEAPPLSPSPLSGPPENWDSDKRLLVTGSVATEGAGIEGERKGEVWVVGVEDFMRRFLPGRSNSKSIFALAQLNGIVKYACYKHLGAKANSFHPSTPRSFYGLTKNKPEGKDMKQIVHDFALSQENGALNSRYEWPLAPDGSKADASFDITDAYLIARYSWHRDVFRAVADNTAAKDRFAQSFRSLHSEKLKATEERSVKMFVKGDMPAAKGKRKLKPMTERSARNAHRKLQDARLTKAYETALMVWFQQRVLCVPRD